MTRTIKTLTGHLTATNKKHINAMLDQGLNLGQIGKLIYSINETSDPVVLSITITKKDRGLIPCPGSALRTSSYTSTAEIN